MGKIILFNQGPQDLRMDELNLLIHAGARKTLEEGEAKKILKIFSGSDQCRIMQCDANGNLIEGNEARLKAEAEAEAKAKAEAEAKQPRR